MEDDHSIIIKLQKALVAGEYETELFDTPAICLANYLGKLLHECARNSVDLSMSVIKKKMASSNVEQNTIDNITKQVQDKFNDAINSNCADLENKILDHFHVSPNALSQDDERLRQLTNEDELVIDEEINILKRRYEKALYLESIMKNEKKEFKNIDALLKASFKNVDKANCLEKTYNNIEEFYENTIIMHNDMTALEELKSSILMQNK